MQAPVEYPRLSNHIHARGLSLAILATLAFVFALQWAQKFFIPLLFGIFIAYTLNPFVTWLSRLKIPRFFATCTVMFTILFGAFMATNTLQEEFQSILNGLPASTQKISRALKKIRGSQPSTMEQMQAAAIEFEKAASQATGTRPAAKKMTAPEQSAFKVSDWLWAGSLSAAEFIGQTTIVVFLVFFLLLSGDTFKRKLVKLSGPSMARKKTAVHILDNINTSVQNYMSMLLATNVLLAIITWIALRWIGLENAGAWAVAAGFLHIIPYFGPLLITVATGLSAFMQFESFSMVLLVSGTSLAIATVVGTLVTTWMTGKIAKMNTAAVFIGLLFWGWLWGIWGMLLGIPIIVIVKVISEHIEGLQPVAELLGE
ncbi:MAG: AI-2E family transporter [Glaciimonas sp.]|nr:AI-2E family transporter [Glaciimonas sp.]